jgi:hypothetical protein
MLTIDYRKVAHLRDRITTSHLPSLPPIRRTHFAVPVLHPPCISAAEPHIKYDKVTHDELEYLREPLVPRPTLTSRSTSRKMRRLSPHTRSVASLRPSMVREFIPVEITVSIYMSSGRLTVVYDRMSAHECLEDVPSNMITMCANSEGGEGAQLRLCQVGARTLQRADLNWPRPTSGWPERVRDGRGVT